jgi:hypothetical protein
MKKTNLKRYFLITSTSVLLMNFFMNCSGFEQSNSSSSVGSTAVISSQPEEQNYSVQSSDQLVRSLASVTGVDYNQTITNEYNTRRALMSTDYDLKTVTAPMLISISNLSSQFCSELVRRESALATAQRSLFRTVDFTRGLTSIQDADFGTELDALSLKFWGRAISTEERTILNELRSAYSQALTVDARNSSTQTRNLMVTTCTSMLSSFEFITL